MLNRYVKDRGQTLELDTNLSQIITKTPTFSHLAIILFSLFIQFFISFKFFIFIFVFTVTLHHLCQYLITPQTPTVQKPKSPPQTTPVKSQTADANHQILPKWVSIGTVKNLFLSSLIFVDNRWNQRLQRRFELRKVLVWQWLEERENELKQSTELQCINVLGEILFLGCFWFRFY